MNFFQFLKSLDDLLFEVVSWLVFYPLSLWRALRRPQMTMDHAIRELQETAERRFDGDVSPPILLLLTVLLAHGIELATIGESPIVARTDGLAGLISNDTSLILLRLISFAAYPLTFAVLTVRGHRQRLTRSTLEPAFFAQTFACAPYALATSLASTLVVIPNNVACIGGIILAVVSVIAFLAVEARWFHRKLGVTTLKALAFALFGFLLSLALILVVGWLIGGATG